jgi:hypothetical protein
MAIRESFDTLSSTGSYDSFYSTDDESSFLLDVSCDTCRDCDGTLFSPRKDCDHGKCSQESDNDSFVDTLDEDIKRWDAAAALYSDEDNSSEYWTSFGDSESKKEQEIAAQYAEQEKQDILRLGNSLLHSAHTGKLLTAFPEYVVPGVITQRSIDLCIGYYMELLEDHPWLEEYIDFLYIHKMVFSAQKQCELIEDKAEQAEQDPVCKIGMSDKVINQSCAARSRKERKRKFNHKTKNSHGKTIESAKKAAKKQYPSWRKKKMGREHAETLVPRDKNEHIKEVFEVCNLKYPKNAPWELDSNWEEATIELWKGPPIVKTYEGSKELWL